MSYLGSVFCVTGERPVLRLLAKQVSPLSVPPAHVGQHCYKDIADRRYANILIRRDRACALWGVPEILIGKGKRGRTSEFSDGHGAIGIATDACQMSKEKQVGSVLHSTVA